MTANDALRDFMVSGADAATLHTYLSDLARNEASFQIGLLQLEAKRLEQEIARLRQAKAEQLLVFVPIFFRSFWTHVSPDEFAAMCGQLDAPQIASPHLEPSPDTVSFMKGRFRALDSVDRDQVLELCRALRHRLMVRAEMREFL